jgi:hypothetical protein
MPNIFSESASPDASLEAKCVTEEPYQSQSHLDTRTSSQFLYDEQAHTTTPVWFKPVRVLSGIIEGLQLFLTHLPSSFHLSA